MLANFLKVLTPYLIPEISEVATYVIEYSNNLHAVVAFRMEQVDILNQVLQIL